MFKKAVLSAGFAGLLFASGNMLNTAQSLNMFKGFFIYNNLAKLVKSGKLQMKSEKKDGFWIVKLFGKNGERSLLYLTADKKHVVIGDILNKNGQPLNFRLPVNANDVKNGVLFTFGKGKKVIYLVTDPQCPFCRMLESQKGETLLNNYKVKVILFPLPFHQYAKAMSYYILAGKTDREKAKRLIATLKGSDEWKKFKPQPAQKTIFDEELAKAKKAAMALQAQGTPSVFDKNFEPLNPFKLK